MTFWVNYSGARFDQTLINNTNCSILNSNAINEANNCTIRIENFDSFKSISDSLFRLIFGQDINGESDMNKIDSLLTGPLIGTYICLMSLIFINVFIALLNSSFQRVYEKAEAYLKLQRANEICRIEILMKTNCLYWPFFKRFGYDDFLFSPKYNPYKD